MVGFGERIGHEHTILEGGEEGGEEGVLITGGGDPPLAQCGRKGTPPRGDM